jgi:hypothetical protein
METGGRPWHFPSSIPRAPRSTGSTRRGALAGFTLALENEHRHPALVQGWYHEAIGLTPVAALLPPGGSAALPPDASLARTSTPDVTAPLPGTDGMPGMDI